MRALLLCTILLLPLSTSIARAQVGTKPVAEIANRDCLFQWKAEFNRGGSLWDMGASYFKPDDQGDAKYSAAPGNAAYLGWEKFSTISQNGLRYQGEIKVTQATSYLKYGKWIARLPNGNWLFMQPTGQTDKGGYTFRVFITDRLGSDLGSTGKGKCE